MKTHNENTMKNERYKTIRKRTANGIVISRLIENRATGERKLVANINAVCNR